MVLWSGEEKKATKKQVGNGQYLAAIHDIVIVFDMDLVLFVCFIIHLVPLFAELGIHSLFCKWWIELDIIQVTQSQWLASKFKKACLPSQPAKSSIFFCPLSGDV